MTLYDRAVQAVDNYLIRQYGGAWGFEPDKAVVLPERPSKDGNHTIEAFAEIGFRVWVEVDGKLAYENNFSGLGSFIDYFEEEDVLEDLLTRAEEWIEGETVSTMELTHNEIRAIAKALHYEAEHHGEYGSEEAWRFYKELEDRFWEGVIA